MQSGKEENYWPGFVDALSNVVLTLVFVLVVFVFALVITSSKVEKKAREMVEAAHERAAQATVPVSLQDLQQKLKEANQQIQILEEKVHELSPTEPENKDKRGLVVVGTVKILVEKGKISILFPKAVSDMNEASMAEFDAKFKELQKEWQGKKLQINSVIGLESYSAARRLAFYRILGIRNHLLTRFGIQGTDIRNTIVQPPEPQNGRIEILYE